MSGRSTPSIDGFGELSEIGRGGSSTVYAALQEPLGRAVAIKVLQVDLGDESARRRFERECAVVGALGDAPGIVPVYAAVYTDDGRGCIVMRLMRSSLASVLERHGPLSVAQARAVGIAAATALDHAHARGVVHRDVKPANLLLSEFDEIALADFDIASVGAIGASTTTQESMSPPHAPPERLNGDLHAGPAGDVWALGSTLFTLLEGRPPFGSPSSEGGMAGLVDRVLHQPMPEMRSDVPDAFVDAIGRALRKDPSERWPDATSFAAALAAVPVETGDVVRWPAAPSGHSPVPQSAVAPARATAPAADPPAARTWLAPVLIGVTVVIALVVALLLALG
ncbi:MAG: serine/threonine-protein kinase [Acidimicrobiales bacterium]